MATARTAEIEDFARIVFRLVEHLGRDGRRVPLRTALAKAEAACPEHPYARAMREKPARRIAFSAAAERVRKAEFPHIARKKAATRRNAPVHFVLERQPAETLASALVRLPDPEPAPIPSPPEAIVPGAGRRPLPPRPSAPLARRLAALLSTFLGWLRGQRAPAWRQS